TTEKLGLYFFAILVGNTVYFIPTSLAQPIFPRMIRTFAESNNNYDALNKFVLNPFIIITLLTPVAIFVLFIMLNLLVPMLFPSYTESIKIISILSIYYFFYSNCYLLGNFLITIKKVKFLL